MPEKKQFIKYMNRKLYAKHSGKYVTMEELDKMVGDGDVIEVLDDRTGEDHTVYTLARLVYDRCRASKEAFEVPDLLKLLSKRPVKATRAA